MVIFTYCFLASNIGGAVGGTIGTILVLIIVAIICGITIVAIKKKRKRQNVRGCNTQEVELQTIRSPETTQRTNQTGLSIPLPNTTLSTIPQRQNQCSNIIGPNEAPNVVRNQIMAPNQQQKSAPQASHQLSHQQSFNTQNRNQGRQLNTSAVLISSATLPVRKTTVQTSKRQGSNINNRQAQLLLA